MTKYRKGPQRTTKDRKGALHMTKYRKGPQRSIIQDHRGSAIMRKLPDLQQFGGFFSANSFIYNFVMLFFCEFWSFNEIK